MKKVKNCTIEELENWFINKYGYVPSHIDIYWYDVRFFGNEYLVTYLLKDSEIEVR